MISKIYVNNEEGKENVDLFSWNSEGRFLLKYPWHMAWVWQTTFYFIYLFFFSLLIQEVHLGKLISYSGAYYSNTAVIEFFSCSVQMK